MNPLEENDYEMAYEVVRAAMKIVSLTEETGKLQSLKNALYLASDFVSNELDELPDKAKELGLDKWLYKESNEEMRS